MLTLLIGTDWTANREEILNRMARDVKNRKGGRVLLVPELISHETERLLCQYAEDTASRYAEVISFSRLARRAAEEAGGRAISCMDNGGRVVAMAAASRQLSSKLKAYASVETRPEFLAELIDAVDEFKRCCISSADLLAASRETEGSLAQKLEELSLLMETYDALCSMGKRDPRDQMTWYLEYLEQNTFGQEHEFYIDGFPDFTRQNYAVLEHLIQVSPHVTVSLNCDAPDSKRLSFEKAGSTAGQLLKTARKWNIPVEIQRIPEKVTPFSALRDTLFQGTVHPDPAMPLKAFRADSIWAETMAAAALVKQLVHNGARYRDISLVCADIGAYRSMIRMIFHRMEIPIYQSGTEEILQESIISTVLTALDAALSDYDTKSVMRYLRSALSGVDQETCDFLENYAFVWGIRGMRWVKPWELNPDGLGVEFNDNSRKRLLELNNAREAAINPLERLRQSFRAASDVRGQVRVLYTFLDDIGLEERLAQLAEEMDAAGDNRSAQILNQLWEILMSALEQMYDVLGETHWEPEHFQRLLRLLLSQYDVGTIPPVLDAVQVGPVNAMRCHAEKHLIVLGAQEGNLPSYSGSAGVLTDQDRVTLRALGVPLTGGAMEGIQEEFAEIYGVFCGASESIQIFCSDKQPSFVFRRLAEIAGGEANVPDSVGFAGVNRDEAGAWLAEEDQFGAAQQMGLTEEFLRVKERAEYTLGKVDKANIRALYGKTLALSASQIDRQAECRLSYFLQYGLKIKERKEASVDPAEFGSYVHKVLEDTCRDIRNMGGFRCVTLEETLELAHQHSQIYAQERFGQIDSERVTYLFRRNLRELDMVVEELWEELQLSLFDPVDFEVGFGKGESLPAIDLPNEGMDAYLRGFVDRVDIWQSPGSRYYRVVDYKTGKKAFDYCDVFNGVGLQMLLYLFALQHSGQKILGEHAIPAGVQYFPARAPYISVDGEPDPQQLEDERRKSWKRSGLLLKDQAVLQAMEPGEDPARLNYKIRKSDGELVGDLADRDQLKLLERYVFHIVGKLVEDIASGNVEPNPYTRGNSHNACHFCPYGSVCHSDSAAERRNYASVASEQFWKDIEEEMIRNGR